MRPPRISLAWWLLGMAIAGFPCAVLGSVLRGRPVLGLGYCLDMGYVPTATVAGSCLFAIIGQRCRRSPFAVRFVAGGWLAVFAYIACCRASPDLVATPIVYYINEIESRFTDADTPGLYSLSLIIRGLILSIPQLLLALVVGLLAATAWGRRRSSRPPSLGQTTAMASVEDER